MKIPLCIVLITTLILSCESEKSSKQNVVDAPQKTVYFLDLDTVLVNCSLDEYLDKENDWNDKLITFRLKTNLPEGTKVIVSKGAVFNSAANGQDPRLMQSDTITIDGANINILIPPEFAAAGYYGTYVDTTLQSENIQTMLKDHSQDPAFTNSAGGTFRIAREKDEQGIERVKIPLSIEFYK